MYFPRPRELLEVAELVTLGEVATSRILWYNITSWHGDVSFVTMKAAALRKY